MNFNHTSSHARVFDSVRTARYRAFSDQKSPVPENSCALDNEPATALWIEPVTGDITPVCQAHLIESFDSAYAVGDNPPVVVPLKRRRA